MNNICIAFWLQHFKVDTFTCQCPPVDKLCNCNTVSEVSKKIFNIFHTADELQMYHSSSIIDWSLLFNSTLLTREAMYGKTRFTKRLKSFYLPGRFCFLSVTVLPLNTPYCCLTLPLATHSIPSLSLLLLSFTHYLPLLLPFSACLPACLAAYCFSSTLSLLLTTLLPFGLQQSLLSLLSFS